MKSVVILCYGADREAIRGGGRGMARQLWETLSIIKQIDSAQLSFKILAHGPSPTNLILRNLKKLKFFLKIKSVEASLYHAITPILGIPLALFDKSPFVVTIHDSLPLHQHYVRNVLEVAWNASYIGYVLDKADVVITTAQYWKRELIRVLNLPSKKIHVIYNGVNAKEFKPIPGLRTHGDARTVLYIGVPTKLQGLNTLIKAVALASNEVKDLTLILGGDLPYYALSKLCKKLGVNARFLGFIPEDKLPHVYNLADVFVNPPTDEFSLMLLEAMACGTPVIARDIFQMREYLGDAALMVNSEEPSELAEAIIKLLSDEELWYKLSRRCLERAKVFTWERAAENIYNIYIKLLDESQRQI